MTVQCHIWPLRHIVPLAIWHHLFTFWLVDTGFFAHSCDQRAVIRLDNARQLNIRKDKKLFFQMSHTQPPDVRFDFQDDRIISVFFNKKHTRRVLSRQYLYFSKYILDFYSFIRNVSHFINSYKPLGASFINVKSFLYCLDYLYWLYFKYLIFCAHVMIQISI